MVGTAVKKTALAIILISALLFSVVAGTELVKIAEANPWIIFDPVNPIPGTIPPIITISSPENNTVYAYTAFNLTVHITKPQPPLQQPSGISYARYTLDGNTESIYFCDHYSSDSPPGLPELDYSQILSALPDGNHELLVESAGVVLPGHLTIFTVYANSTVFFTTSHTFSSPSPSPSPTPTSTLAPTPTPAATPEPSFPATLVFVTSVGIVLAVVGLVVYLKKFHRNKSP
jgi:hypothetical protein